MATREIEDHQSWLGLLQPTGLLVAPAALVRRQALLESSVGPLQGELRALIENTQALPLPLAGGGRDPGRPIPFLSLAEAILAWNLDDVATGDAIPADLVRRLPDYEETLRPDLVALDPVDRSPILLVKELPPGTDFDDLASDRGWRASPHQKLERLLRETQVPVGVLFDGDRLRLVYAPRGESSGYGTFSLSACAEVMNRPLFSALTLLLGEHRVFGAPDGERLTDLLKESRQYQNEVSTKLAEQVLDALWELLRGFQAADELAQGRLLSELIRDQRDREHLYEGLLAVLMRLVFLLYAEEQELMPKSEVYAKHYSVSGLFEKLRDDAALHVDTMDQRYGAWSRLSTLFRLVFDGGQHGDLRFPPRSGRLFDPDTWGFLEGRARGVRRVLGEPIELPKVSDGTIYRVLERLFVLDGERLSYRALDVEQIGSVYEAMMGFRVESAAGRAVAVKPKSGKSAHVVVDLDALLKTAGPKRKKLLSDEADCDLPAKSDKELAAAKTTGELLSALGKRLSPRTPHLLAPGSLYLQPTEERRRSGSHYTPRELSQPIVETTLSPLLRTIEATHEAPPTSEQILSLKVCDPAMGSGAFLVEACRYLGDRVLEAWDREGKTARVAAEHGEPLVHARRLVAQRSLYGVDKNAAAVDLAKLSLWLVTLSAEEPFTFLDHALRHGDSLVGLSLDQIKTFGWETETVVPLFSQLVTQELERAQDIRDQILALADKKGVEVRREKESLLRQASDATDNARLIGDVLVGAFFAADKKKAREEERERRLELITRWLRDSDAEAKLELDDLRAEILERLPVFHWMLEFPEVFYQSRPDPLEGSKVNRAAFMDAFVGNPPFMGVARISGGFGAEFRDWLFEIHPGSGGKSDLVAHFFRRAATLLGAHGTIGLIATNTIGQTDTRASGLQILLRGGFAIYAATQSRTWPQPGAAVHVAIVHLVKGTPLLHVPLPVLAHGHDARTVEAINSRLRGKPERPDPVALRSNANLSFLGCYVAGQGFTFDDAEPDGTPISEMERLLAKDPPNAERIFPYIGGEEVNSDPEQRPRRYIINFAGMDLEEAARWPDLLTIVREKVKPYRDGVNRKAHRDAWWQYGDRRPGLYAALPHVKRCLANSQVSKHLLFAWQPTDRVFAHTLYVYPVEHNTFFAVVQSRVHEGWARLLSSSLEDRLRYTPSDCFETFPFPEPDPRAVIPALEELGARLDAERAAYMVAEQVGLTELYNRLKDPEHDDPRILALRALHEDLDRAVLRAYGWNGIQVPPYCLRTEEDRRAHERFEDDVIDRLFVLNEQRAAEEARTAALTTKPTTPKPPKKRKKPSENPAQPSLPGTNEE